MIDIYVPIFHCNWTWNQEGRSGSAKWGSWNTGWVRLPRAWKATIKEYRHCHESEEVLTFFLNWSVVYFCHLCMILEPQSKTCLKKKEFHNWKHFQELTSYKIIKSPPPCTAWLLRSGNGKRAILLGSLSERIRVASPAYCQPWGRLSKLPLIYDPRISFCNFSDFLWEIQPAWIPSWLHTSCVVMSNLLNFSVHNYLFI